MAGRVTRRPEAPLTEEERSRLAEARLTVATLSEREPPHEALTEVGYEQRQARAESIRHAVALLESREFSAPNVVRAAVVIYDYLWHGRTPDGDLQG